MTHTTAIINQKGGVGKTTTAAALASGLSLKGYKVLAVDLDPQCNLSYSFGVQPGGHSALELITKGTAAAVIAGGLAVIAGDRDLAGADSFITGKGKENKLKAGLDPFRGRYDYIVIDTPPALGILTINALAACQSAIIPAQADIFSLHGIEQLADTLEPVKALCNPGLQLDGILLTRYSGRTVLSRELAEAAEQLAAKLDTHVFKTAIREAVSIREAQLNQQPLYSYAPKAKATADYTAFVAEFLARRQNHA